MKTAKKTKKSKPAAPAPETVLVLRTSDKDRKAHRQFQWPESGLVEAPYWNPKAECGNGLHGLLMGVGDITHLHSGDPSRVWQVVEVEKASIVDLNQKVKFPKGIVVYSGERDGAVAMIKARHPEAAVAFAVSNAGNRGTATAGYAGTATAGDSGTATAGNRGTATAGDSGTATAGNRGTATAGDSGTATAGDSGTATAGYAGTATAGDSGTATAGYAGTATAGYAGTATAGDSGTATAGEKGEIRIRWYDSSADRYRTAIGYVGEDGILAHKGYKFDGKKFVEAES